MTEQEIITKAKKALDALGISYSKDILPQVLKTENELLYKMDESLRDRYSISFELRLPNNRTTSIFVAADRKTNKLLYVITSHKQYAIPVELT